MRRFVIAAMIIDVICIFSTAACCAGYIRGQLLDPRGVPQPGIYTTCHILGLTTTYIAHGYTATSTDPAVAGTFGWNMAPGTYAQGFSEKSNLPVLYRSGIVVPGEGDAPYATLQYEPAAYCRGTEELNTECTVCAQSFRATGTNLVSVSLRCSYPLGGELEVMILDGDDPAAPQIGPRSFLKTSATEPEAAYWNAGEVPTVPGKIHTATFRLIGGGTFRPYVRSVFEKMRAEIPDGRTWVDGALIDRPLEVTVNMDDAGITNTVCCATSYSTASVSQHAGQSFIARGTSVLAVTWVSNKTNYKMDVTVHDGIGPGSGGPQIGPKKVANSPGPNARGIVTFAPGEVPTVPGNTYFVKLRSTNGTSYLINTTSKDWYTGGSGYINFGQQHYDLAIGIYEETSPGSSSRALAGMSNFRVESVGTDTAVVAWETDVLADSTVDYGKTTPYTLTAYNSTLTTSHLVQLTNLEPNTMYHVRAISRASGYRESRSADMVFVTAPQTGNLLANPGFEGGTPGAWTIYGDPEMVPAGWSYGAGARTGNWGIGAATEDGVVYGGAYQRVPAEPGNEYRLSAWLFSYCEGDLSTRDRQTVMRIGIDPTGGTNPQAASVKWTPFTNSQSGWTQVGLSAVATSNYVTVFLHGGNDSECAVSAFSFDDVVLTASSGGTITPQDSTLYRALAEKADGSYLRIADVKCAATAAQTGAYYVQSLQRVCGLRVETTDSALVGEKVTVTGTLRTKPSGERYLENAHIESRVASSAPEPIYACAAELGGSGLGLCKGIPGSVGPYNAGMLMRISGKVRNYGSGCIYVNDGSVDGEGIKVDTSALSTVPVVGSTVGITGIVTLEGTAGSASVVLKPRNSADVQAY